MCEVNYKIGLMTVCYYDSNIGGRKTIHTHARTEALRREAPTAVVLKCRSENQCVSQHVLASLCGWCMCIISCVRLHACKHIYYRHMHMYCLVTYMCTSVCVNSRNTQGCSEARPPLRYRL